MSQPSLTERLGIAGTGAVAAGLARLAAAHGEVVVWDLATGMPTRTLALVHRKQPA